MAWRTRRSGLECLHRPQICPPHPQHPAQAPERAGASGAVHSHHLSRSILLSADEPTSPKKPKSVPEPEPSDVECGATSPLSSEWTSVRISPGQDTVGQDVLAVRVLVTSDDSRYAQTAGDGGG